MAEAIPNHDARLVAHADSVPRRHSVPSAREVELGQAAGGYEPVPPPPPEPKLSWRERMADVREGMNPWRITQGYQTEPLIVVSVLATFQAWDDHAFRILLPEIRDDLGIQLTYLATIYTLVKVLGALVGPLAGHLADRWNRVWMTGVGGIVTNLGTIASGLAPSAGALVGARVVGGVGYSLNAPASWPLLTDYYPQDRRARVFGFMALAGLVGAIVGPLVGGVLANHFGWRPTLVLLGGLAACLSLLAFRLKEPPRGVLDRRQLGADDETAAREQPPMSWTEGWRAASSIVTLRRLWYATFFMTSAGEGIGVFLYFFYADVFGVSPFGRAVIFALQMAMTLVGISIGGPYADRLLAGGSPGRVLVAFGSLVVIGAVSLVGLMVTPVLWLAVGITLPLALLSAAVLPATGALMSLVVPARLRGLGMQTFSPWRLAGYLVVPILIAIVEPYGLRWGIVGLVPIFLIGALILLSAAPWVARDIRAATAASLADEAARAARAEGNVKLLVIRDLDVAYDGTLVLFNVDLDVEDGELIAVLGTNGAGKSTLLRAIVGVQEAANGAVLLDGRDITHRPPHENAADGIVFLPGGRAIFSSLTVAENLRAAAWLHRDDEVWIRQRTTEVLELFPELEAKLDQVAGTMSGGEQQMVALGQALLAQPRLLMIDELSLGLAPAVVERLLQAVERINARGATVVLVEQSVNIALTIARRAVFMEKGRKLFDGPTEDLLARGDLVRSVFLGGAGAATRPQRARPLPTADERPQVLEIDDAAVAFGGVRALNGVSLHVDAGEVVGIIGPNGAGKTTLYDVVSGYVRPDHGQVVVDGIDVTGLSPDARARLGLGRSFQNARLFPSITVRENIAVALERHLAVRSAIAEAAWLPVARKSERRVWRRVERLIDLLNLEAYADKFVSELSTGGRRMVDLACVMAAEPKILLLDEPSSGLAQAETEALAPVILRLVRETGCGVVVIEHDMPLITGVSDRMLAMELGAVIAAGSPSEVTNDPRVLQSYLAASQAVIQRSGKLFEGKI